MRRWSGLLTACGLALVAAAGCHHTAGVCDCDPWHCHAPLPPGHHDHGIAHGVVDGHAVGAVPGAFPTTPGVGPQYSGAFQQVPDMAVPAPRTVTTPMAPADE